MNGSDGIVASLIVKSGSSTRSMTRSESVWAVAMASGLLLGPFGLPIAAAADANQEQQRKLFAREVHMRCSSLPLPKGLQMNPSRSGAEKSTNKSR